ncbi:hypothetical protein EDM76_09515 [bacterium]|nr:MAG: hypothetical protein EDM76_09515 [bacterium]MCL4231672.1 YkgJ family cysteine cluster protein [Dehalococcoidia bacterium]
MAGEELDEWLRELWGRVASRCPEFDLVLPGTASFVCQAAGCPAHCCRVFTIVPLGGREVVRLSRASGLPPLELVECEDGEPLTHRAFPPTRPYFLARREGVCRFLGADLLCCQYEGRPDACRVYPFYVFFFDPATYLPMRPEWRMMRSAVDRLTGGNAVRAESGPVPLLLRHAGCPGSAGPALRRVGWLTLVEETFRLQYDEPPGPAGEP